MNCVDAAHPVLLKHLKDRILHEPSSSSYNWSTSQPRYVQYIGSCRVFTSSMYGTYWVVQGLYIKHVQYIRSCRVFTSSMYSTLGRAGSLRQAFSMYSTFGRAESLHQACTVHWVVQGLYIKHVQYLRSCRVYTSSMYGTYCVVQGL